MARSGPWFWRVVRTTGVMSGAEWGIREAVVNVVPRPRLAASTRPYESQSYVTRTEGHIDPDAESFALALAWSKRKPRFSMVLWSPMLRR